MEESFIQFLWAEGLIARTDLRTSQGEAVDIIDRGEWNMHSGPDFLNAIVKVGQITWAGPVEVHLKSSDWYHHNHQKDPAYNNVILHLVLELDKMVEVAGSRNLPTLVLPIEKYEYLYVNYINWVANGNELYCASELKSIPKELWQTWIGEMSAIRFSEKQNEAWQLLESTKGDYELAYWGMMAKTIGGFLNGDTMRDFVRGIPWISVRRKTWCWPDFESFLLHFAGLRFSNEGVYWSKVFHLEPWDKSKWKWGRIRPSSFPEVRLLQWGWIYFHKTLRGEVTFPYWTKSAWKDFNGMKPGEASRQGWKINSAPAESVLFEKGDPKDVSVWEDLPPEINRVVRKFDNAGMSFTTARETQGVLYLDKAFCGMKKCLNCAIGKYYLKKKTE